MSNTAIHPSHRAELRLLRQWLIALLAGLLAVWWLPTPDAARGLAGYAPLHTVLEVLAIAVVAMVFGVSWATQRYRVDGRAMVLGVVFLGVGLLDLSHTLSYQGMPDFITPSGSEKAINFWLAARALGALGMLWMAFWPRHRDHTLNRLPRRPTLWAVLGGVLLMHLLILLWPERLPRTFVPGTGLTRFKLGAEYLLIALYLAAAIGYLRHLAHERVFGAALLAGAALTMAMSEFFFTLYANVTDIYNLLGHVYKVLAYGFLYQALFVDSVQSPFLDLQAAQARQQATLDTLPDLLFEIDSEGLYRAVHATDTGQLAAPAQQLLGRSIREVLPPAAVEACAKAMQEARERGVSRGTRIELAVPDGVSHFELSVARTPHLLAGREGFLVLSRDVTAAVRQEARIRFEAEFNAALLDLQDHLDRDNENQLLQRAVGHARRLTGSPLAFLHAVYEPAGGLGAGPAQTELVAWASDNGPAPDTSTAPPPWCQDSGALWAEALRQREPVVHNAVGALPQGNHGSAPDNTADPARRLISVPVIDAHRLCVVLVVAGRDSDYGANMVQALRILATAVWNLIKRKRQDSEILRLSQALEQSPYPVVVTDAEVRIQYVNRAFTDLSGYAPDEVLGHNPRLLQSGQTPLHTYQTMWQRLSQEQPWQGEFINRRKNGTHYVERALVYPIHDAHGRLTHYVAHKEDVTLRKAAEDRIRELSSFDALTGLLNKKAIDEHLSAAVAQAQQQHNAVALLWFDLDNFKAVNDSLGHAVGDELLLECSQRLRQVFSPPAALGRYSGDSFLAIVPGAEQAAVALLAQEALRRLQQAVRVQGSELVLSASVGIASCPSDAATASLLAAAAESAMYRVKEEGRNGFRFFAPDMQAHSQRSLELAADLRLAAQRGELHLVYQPQCALADHRLVGAEALLRWQHPKWGALSPAEFIPLAEQTGAIVDIGLWVVEQAARQWRLWHNAGLELGFVAVNVSAIQFAQPDLFDQLRDIAQRQGVPPQSLEVELTEAVALRDPEGAGTKIRRLHEAGFRVSIDDFGTGYSSMSYLKRYALDKLKIDQSFVRDLGQGNGDLAIVTAIVKMAHALGMKTIAEGVETQEQMALLKDAGCDEIQGYWYARPMAPEALEAFVASSPTTPL